MEKERVPMLAVSLAGHDKGKRYVVVSEDETGVFLCDGKNKLLDHPKRKNRKHVQLIKHLPEGIAGAITQVREDADVRRILAEYDRVRTMNEGF